MNIELELITACIRNERKAQNDLYKQSYGFLMSICRRYANSMYEADDLLNIGFLKILNNLDKYQPKIPFGIWMRRVMINVIIDEFRKTKQQHEKINYVENYQDNQVLFDLNGALEQMGLDDILSCIGKLPQMSQKVFNLFAIDGYGHKEIADMLGMTEGTSKWHVNSARQKLQEMIKELVPTMNLAVKK